MSKKQVFIAAFVIDPAEYSDDGKPVGAEYVVSHLAQTFGEQDGVSDLIVWASPDDMMRDHIECGPIDVGYLTTGESDGAHKPEKIPSRVFVEGEWSFRPYSPGKMSNINNFRVHPKGSRREFYGSRADMTAASDGKTWMFTVFSNGMGRQDARPSFAEAKAEVLRLLGDGKNR